MAEKDLSLIKQLLAAAAYQKEARDTIQGEIVLGTKSIRPFPVLPSIATCSRIRLIEERHSLVKVLKSDYGGIANQKSELQRFVRNKKKFFLFSLQIEAAANQNDGSGGETPTLAGRCEGAHVPHPYLRDDESRYGGKGSTWSSSKQRGYHLGNTGG